MVSSCLTRRSTLPTLTPNPSLCSPAKTDEELMHDPSGCTAVTALLVHDTNTIYVANAGDSRAVMSVSGKAEPMSWDHKPGNQSTFLFGGCFEQFWNHFAEPFLLSVFWHSLFLRVVAAEVARIIAAGGFVEFGRVNGNLALSRAIGDFEFKQNPQLDAESQIVTAFPDVEQRKLDVGKEGTMEFLVLACDGGLSRRGSLFGNTSF